MRRVGAASAHVTGNNLEMASWKGEEADCSEVQREVRQSSLGKRADYPNQSCELNVQGEGLSVVEEATG